MSQGARESDTIEDEFVKEFKAGIFKPFISIFVVVSAREICGPENFTTMVQAKLLTRTEASVRK
jgi:hypothetical protein